MELEWYGWIYGIGIAVSAMVHSTRHGIRVARERAEARERSWKDDIDQKQFQWHGYVAAVVFWPCVFWMHAVALGLSPYARRRAKLEDAQRRLTTEATEKMPMANGHGRG
ncbi:hypothetical protein LCGC14_0772130 [marine sediment metagenome]|uniref:Uncharacterized protein n=1 Tax=marine sediment metagenome TaxID=412755 RepID=A0A0F9PY57_9ZZZZ